MKKIKMTFVLICLAICLSLTSNTWAACERIGNICYPGSQSNPTLNQADVQDCVSNYAQAGDTVSLPAGISPAWTTPVTATNKDIEIKGPPCALDANGLVTSCPTTIIIGGTGGSCTQLNPVSAFCFKTTSGTTGTSSTGMSVKKVSWSLHDMVITGSPSGTADVIGITSSMYDYPIQGWRIHHVKMDFASQNIYGGKLITIIGMEWGLIDHVSFLSQNTIALTIQGWLDSEYNAAVTAGVRPYQSFEGRTLWGLPLNLGSDEALYVEDSFFSWTQTSGNPIVNDAVAGVQLVFRHNYVTTGTVYSHTGEGGLLGRGGMKKFEIYNNSFSGAGVNAPITFQENGTGVIYNNKMIGYAFNHPLFGLYRASLSSFNYTGYFYGNCWGAANPNYGGGATRSYDGNIESTGWPCLDQIGRGSGVALGTPQPSVPVYIWNNGAQDKCYNPSASGSDCDGGSNAVNLNDTGLKWSPLSSYISTNAHSNGDKDYCVGTTSMPQLCGNHTNTYVAYTYPHPLQAGGGGTSLPVPQRLRIGL
jgi:hypothetical protein